MSTTPTQGFQLHPSLAGLDPEELRKRYDAADPDMRRALGFVRPATPEEFTKENESHGAPEDFGGAVYTSSMPPVVSDDTDPGIPVTRMPIGVSFQRQNAIGPPALNLSNPPAAQFLGQGLATVGVKMAAPKLDPDSFMAQQPKATQLSPDTFMAQQASRPTASIGPADAGAGAWFRNLQSDMRYGGTSTLPGKAIHFLKGSPESETGRNLDSGLYGGTSPNTAEFLGGPVIGPGVIGEGASQLGEHPVQGFNKIVRGAAQTLAPAIGATVPGALPGAIAYGGIGKGTEATLGALGADRDWSEFGGNVAALAAPKGIPKAGGFLERNAVPIGKAAGVGTALAGAAEGIKTGNPWWIPTLGAASERGTKLATNTVRGAGSMLQSMTPESGIPRAPVIPPPNSPVSGLLKARPIELRPSSAPIDTSPEGLLEANRRVVRDPSTGKMKIQYVTSSGGKVIPDEVAIAKSQNRARLADNLDTKGVQETFRNDLNREGQRVRAPFAETPLTKSQSAELFQARPVEVPGESAAEFERRGAPRNLGSDADQAYLKVLENKIATNAPDRLQAIERRTDLLNRMQGVEIKPSDLAPEERAQAGKTRKMSQPRAEVAAPTEARKNLALQPADFLKSRQMQRTQSGASSSTQSSSPAQPSKADIAKAMREGTYQWKRR